MPFVFKTSNPVEAGFVEDFFLKKGLSCRLIPSGGLYGIQGYDVVVEQEVNGQLQTELTDYLKAQEVAPEDEEVESPPKPPDSQEPGFSLVSTLVIFLVAMLSFYSAYYGIYAWSYRWLSGMVTPAGAALFGYLISATFVYICTRKVFEDRTDAFLGLTLPPVNTILIWTSVGLVWRIATIVIIKYFWPVLPPSANVWAIDLLVGPIWTEIIFRGFLLSSLETRIKTVPALLISSLLFGLSHYQLPVGGQALLVCTGLILGIARIKSRSIVPSTLVLTISKLLVFALHL